ncbi:putative pentachlorophenol 4-monooxygenase [Podospora didyma]|uniref:Pentachlorophenol 4-monooxygenase n=1 Tax=Podospora didyma TaxID=330526 RepID=A0AAE0NX70_9PEZI|nr:putative pentachlorophenol 4-monooxygenase [Podospora didyma]
MSVLPLTSPESNMNELYDVVIAGGGPAGLFLASELAMARASVLVLERDVAPASPLKLQPLGWRGLNTPSIEAFYRRGLLDTIFEPDNKPAFFERLVKTPGFQPGGHFAGILLNANKLDLSRHKYRLPGPGLKPAPAGLDRIEAALNARAESLGVTILRGYSVTKIAAQDDTSVMVEAGGQDGESESFRGRWLVGCDGGRSIIRKAAGFDFVGTDPKFTGYAAHCELDHPEKLERGFCVTKHGLYVSRPPVTLYLLDFDNSAGFDRQTAGPITQEHIQGILNRITGIPELELKITKFHLATSFTDRSKQATSYRKGRVLLAGDAAHIHPPFGGQGLNLGLGDAINLGWKLAATVQQEKTAEGGLVDLALLDTYEKERHPIAQWVLEWTRAQGLALEPSLHSIAVRKLVSDLIDTTDGTNLFIDRVWGLSQRYILGDGKAHAHPLVGSSAPDLELSDDSRLSPKLGSGRGLLVDLEDDAPFRSLLESSKYEAKVGYLHTGAKDKLGLRAFLVRPDGIVAWVADDSEEPDLDAGKLALEQWFGH